MNIVIVIDSLVGGGAEKVMLTLAEKMAKLHYLLRATLSMTFLI